MGEVLASIKACARALCKRVWSMPSHVRMPAAAMAAAVILVGTAGMASADASPAGASAAVITAAPSPIAGSERAAGSSAPCFKASYPDCSSTDPDVSWGASSNGDTTGCEFQMTVAWGDGKTSVYTFPGASDGSQLATFTHTYSRPGAYTIQATGQTTQGSCSSFDGTLEFTLLSSCASSSAAVYADVPGSGGQCSYCPTPPAAAARSGPVGGTSLAYFWAQAYTPHTTADYAAGTFKVADPTVVAGDCHSLAELAVSSEPTIDTGFSTPPNNTIEVGWTVDPSLDGQTGGIGPHLPHLFVYYWVNGASGCYDTFCPGFVKVGNLVGSVLPVGSKPKFSIKYSRGDWDIFDGGELIGYYPGKLWNRGFTEFHTARWFGEVAAGPGVTSTCTQMGNGEYASSSDADTITGLTLRNGARELEPSVYTQNLTPNYYTAEKTSPTAIRFGGAGSCSPFA